MLCLVSKKMWENKRWQNLGICIFHHLGPRDNNGASMLPLFRLVLQFPRTKTS